MSESLVARVGRWFKEVDECTMSECTGRDQ